MNASNLVTKLKNCVRRTLSTRLARRIVTLKGNCPVVSFTFDDFPRSALEIGGALLQDHGLRGTFYASLGLMDSQAPTGLIFGEVQLRELIAQGHELGCHTYAHCHAWETKPNEFHRSIIENRTALNRIAPHAAFESLSYPISCPRPYTKRIASRYFRCCRGGGQTFNQGKTDLNLLRAFFLEKCHGNFNMACHLIDENRVANGWLIFATHDITQQPTRFGVTPSFFEKTLHRALNSESVILPVSEALSFLFTKSGSGTPARSDK